MNSSSSRDFRQRHESHSTNVSKTTEVANSTKIGLIRALAEQSRQPAIDPGNRFSL
jgi:hypothetical protein